MITVHRKDLANNFVEPSTPLIQFEDPEATEENNGILKYSEQFVEMLYRRRETH